MTDTDKIEKILCKIRDTEELRIIIDMCFDRIELIEKSKALHYVVQEMTLKEFNKLKKTK